jgi:coenzyme F420-reducing hydrogenase beta subunit
VSPPGEKDMAMGWKEIDGFVQKHDYCCGCGVCAGICPHGALDMCVNEPGEYRPHLAGECTDCGACSKACPFINGNANEDELARMTFADIPDIKHTRETGHHLGAFAGYVADPAHRWQGASGGMATWFLQALLRAELVDHVICVTPRPDARKLFAFEIVSHPDEIIRGAKSAYYPVELSQVLRTVQQKPGRYALIGLPCVIKAVRLAALSNAKVRERVVVYAGLTCGQLKTKGFAEVLVRKMGLNPAEIRQLSFRDKAAGRPANDFSVTAGDDKKNASVAWRGFYGIAWTSGMFKLHACNFCDDTFAELADVSFMDAWLPEYSAASSGTSLVITRSLAADRIIRGHGMNVGGCVLQEIGIEKAIKSQAAVILSKRYTLPHRLWMEAKAGRPAPRKREGMKRPGLLQRAMILNAEDIRRQSAAALDQQRRSGKPGIGIFLAAMRRSLLIGKWLQQAGRVEGILAGVLQGAGIFKKTIREGER